MLLRVCADIKQTSIRMFNAQGTTVFFQLPIPMRCQVFQRSVHNQPKDDSESEQGIHVGDALLEALAAPGLRVAQGRAVAPKRRRKPADGEDAREEPHARGGKRKQGVLVDVPDVSKEGRCVCTFYF